MLNSLRKNSIANEILHVVKKLLKKLFPTVLAVNKLDEIVDLYSFATNAASIFLEAIFLIRYMQFWNCTSA